MSWRLVLLLCQVVALCVADGLDKVVSVDTPVGKILGYEKHVEDISVEAFYNVPFAKPPLGELRFALPQPFGRVEQIEAPKSASACPQPSFINMSFPASEDCLHLSVFRKAGTKQGDEKPVIVVIHGGGFSMGSGTNIFQNTEPLVAFGDVITVNLNYRLGILGFGDMKELAPGNLGLFDQRLALEWVQDNIRAFGGNPDKVTLLGISAGSMCIHAHLASPLTKQGRPLFHAAIMDAGVLFDGFVEKADVSLARMTNIAKQVNCSTENGADMLACLREADVEDLVRLSLDREGYSPVASFLPTVDGKFLVQEPLKQLLEDNASLAKVKLMIGYTRDEGTFFASYNTDFTGTMFPNLTGSADFADWCAKLVFGYKFPVDVKSDEGRHTLLQEYFEKTSSKRLDAAEFMKDGLFACPSNAFIRSYSKVNAPVYVYRFDRKLSQPYLGMNPDKLGAFHGSPFLHMTGTLMKVSEVVPNSMVDAQDRQYFLDTIQMVAEFARSDEVPKFRGIEWPDFTKSEGGVMVFCVTGHVEKGLHDEARCKKMFPVFEKA